MLLLMPEPALCTFQPPPVPSDHPKPVPSLTLSILSMSLVTVLPSHAQNNGSAGVPNAEHYLLLSGDL